MKMAKNSDFERMKSKKRAGTSGDGRYTSRKCSVGSRHKKMRKNA